MAQNLEANHLALDKVLAQAIAMMALEAKGVTYIEDQTDKNTFHVTSYENVEPIQWPMENESVLPYQSPSQGESDSVKSSDFSPLNPLCDTPSQNVAYISPEQRLDALASSFNVTLPSHLSMEEKLEVLESQMSNSRPDHTDELSVTMPMEIGHNSEYEYEEYSGATNNFPIYQEENQFEGQYDTEFENQWETHQKSGYELWAHQPEPTTTNNNDIPKVVMNMNRPYVEPLDNLEGHDSRFGDEDGHDQEDRNNCGHDQEDDNNFGYEDRFDHEDETGHQSEIENQLEQNFMGHNPLGMEDSLACCGQNRMNLETDELENSNSNAKDDKDPLNSCLAHLDSSSNAKTDKDPLNFCMAHFGLDFDVEGFIRDVNVL